MQPLTLHVSGAPEVRDLLWGADLDAVHEVCTKQFRQFHDRPDLYQPGTGRRLAADMKSMFVQKCVPSATLPGPLVYARSACLLAATPRITISRSMQDCFPRMRARAACQYEGQLGCHCVTWPEQAWTHRNLQEAMQPSATVQSTMSLSVIIARLLRGVPRPQ